ncbi:MAG: Dam family site-specific DNA-(adenine-N6)-methyltransferase [Candidatus Promineofilum sp.]|nr:Dam family site-specific DNA-(adenine-N6)-methyltransferase [Promineifilum sp.]
MKPSHIQPVIKWTGSKRTIAPFVGSLIPYTPRAFEPFIGGGAILPFHKAPYITAGDVIPELIALWVLIKESPEEVAEGYKERWERLQSEGYTAYYAIRNSFNETRNPVDLLFLSRTCVNGLIRFNSNGDFNNSLHHTRPGILPSRLKQIIVQWSGWLTNVRFVHSDYRHTLLAARPGDFVFLDPPYAGTVGRYMPQEFDLLAFYAELERLNSLGVKWVVTLDGAAGGRQYESGIPDGLYLDRMLIPTGNSPFTKLMGTSIDAVYESVYLNFQAPLEDLADQFKDWGQISRF